MAQSQEHQDIRNLFAGRPESPESVHNGGFKPTIQDLVSEWTTINPAEVVTPEFRVQVISTYIEFHNMQNGNVTEKYTHNTLTDGLYSHHNLPAICAIHEWATAHGDKEMLHSSGMAIYSLFSALRLFNNYAETHECSLAEALAEMRAGVIKGKDNYVIFLGLMDYARQFAALCIQKNINKLPDNLPIVIGKSQTDTFLHRANRALSEFVESEKGYYMDPDFAERLRDPHIKAMVLSIDINSTLNVAESYTNLQYLESAMAQMKKMADKFHKKFPHKKLYIVLNTGRPGDYEWGVTDMIASLPEMRIFHLSESGGVIVHMDGSQIQPEVALDDSDLGQKQSVLWQEQLDNLKKHILENTKERKAKIEKKLSMLSIRTATRLEDGGKPLVTTPEGQLITEGWIREQKKQYINKTRQDRNGQIKEILARLQNMPEAEQYIAKLEQAGEAGQDGILGSPDDLPKKTLEALQEAFQDAKEFRTTELKELQDELKIIDVMEQKLDAKFNAIAGYIDISHTDLNKYSSLLRQIKRDAIQPSEMVVVHVGDSITDDIPTINTGPGEVNECADEVFLLGVQNSSLALREVIRLRRQGDLRIRGGITARREVLGVTDILLGIINVIEESAPVEE